MAIGLDTTTDVLAQLHTQLGDYDPDTRAVVALRTSDSDSVELADVELADNGVLELGRDVDGLVVVSGETVELTDSVETAPLRQLVAILPDGEEVGVFRIGEDGRLYRWSTAEPDENLQSMRPRDATANTARRALGLPSHTEEIPITELLARLWLLHLAQITLEAFDANDARPVGPGAVTSTDTRGPFATILDDPGYPDDETAASRRLAEDITWEDVRQLAVRGEFEIGPYTFDPEHADWLDAAGFAQHFDRTVMATDEILASLEVMSGTELVDWAVDELARRSWRPPSLTAAPDQADPSS